MKEKMEQKRTQKTEFEVVCCAAMSRAHVKNFSAECDAERRTDEIETADERRCRRSACIVRERLLIKHSFRGRAQILCCIDAEDDLLHLPPLEISRSV